MRRLAIASSILISLIAVRGFGCVRVETEVRGETEEESGSGSGSGSGSVESDGVRITAQNPVLGADHPDPDVLRVVGPEGEVTYYLSATSDSGDMPLYTSRDLVRWSRAPQGVFGRRSAPGSSMEINGAHYCSRWAPQIVELGPSSFMLSFSARRFDAPQSPCSPYADDSGVFLAWSDSPLGPFASVDRPWEPLPAGVDRVDPPPGAPRSLPFASRGCEGSACSRVLRLDSSYFHDEATGRRFLAYSWYTPSPPITAWDRENHGEHVSITELDPGDPFSIRRDEAIEIHAANPHDRETTLRLAEACPRCGEQLSMTKGRLGEEMSHDGLAWGVNEGAALFRRGEYVYLLASGAVWDSAYYHVFWAAAKTVEGLAHDNPDRLVGRYLIPSRGESFGHGSPVLGPDGERWYYVHHRLRQDACRREGDCARDVWVSPIEFEDHGDGLGDVHIAPRFPAEDPSVEVTIAREATRRGPP